MAKDKRKIEKNKQKKLAKKKAKAKIRQPQSSSRGTPFEFRFGLSRQDIQQAPLIGAWMPEDISENGMGTVVVARQIGSNKIAAGVFLLDVWCLGVKNSFLRIYSTAGFDDLLASIKAGEVISETTPETATKLIVESVDYARSLSFSPDSDFKDARVVLAGIDISRCSDTFEFGQEGKPFYFSGPRDSWQKSNAIIAQLEAACGKGNFHFTVAESIKGDVDGFFSQDELDEELPSL